MEGSETSELWTVIEKHDRCTAICEMKTCQRGRRRIARLAEQSPELGFTSLNHLIDINWLKEAFRLTRKSGAPGVDGQTAQQYEQNLEGNLQSLLRRAKAGTYRAPPVRRKHIPKGSGTETRPIGIPTFEDKVLQRALVMLLEPIYEQDFHEGSYGFRPKRSPHHAMDSLRKETMRIGGGWILEVDLRKFFDTDRKSTRLNSSHTDISRMPSSA